MNPIRRMYAIHREAYGYLGEYPGSPSFYTISIDHARLFDSHPAATRHALNVETVVPVSVEIASITPASAPQTDTAQT